MPEYEVRIGTDIETGKYIPIGDIERRSGLYILGIQGSGKTTLIKSMIFQDMFHGHGVFFLDPHGDAIEDLLARIPDHRKEDVYVLDPTDDTHTFGINLFSCLNPDSLRERSASYAQAEHIFTKLFANPQTEELDILLSEYLPNAFYPLIANEGLTILEIPLLLRDQAFRAKLLKNQNSIPAETLDFWQEEFALLRPDTQREETASTRRRINLFRTHEYVKHIVGQSRTTVDFTDIMDNGKILFVKLSTTLAPRVRDLIGTMLVSNLVHAVLQRERIPEAKRRHFCIFVDEFQHFASSEDFAVLFTQGRKYNVATTVAHQERYGQFADNKRMLGATDTAGTKIFLQQSQSDAQRHAVLFAKESPTETRRERILIISQNPVEDILKGHANPQVQAFVTEYLRSLSHRLEDTTSAMEAERIKRQQSLDGAAISRVSGQIIQAQPFTISQAAHVQGVLSSAIWQLRQAQAHNARLLQLLESTDTLRQVMRNLDRFLTETMEGTITKGQEAYARFLLELISVFFPITPVLALYIALEYGDIRVSRVIPFALAVEARMYPAEVSGLLTEAEERTHRERREYLEAENAAVDARIASEQREARENFQKKKAAERAWVEERLFRYKGGFQRKPLVLDSLKLFETFVWLECAPALMGIVAPLTSRLGVMPVEQVRALREEVTSKYAKFDVPSFNNLRFMRKKIAQKFFSFVQTCPGVPAIATLLELGGCRWGIWGNYDERDNPLYSIRPGQPLDRYHHLCMLDYPHIPGADPLTLLRALVEINEVQRFAQADYYALTIWSLCVEAEKSATASLVSFFGLKPQTPHSIAAQLSKLRQEYISEYLSDRSTPWYYTELKISDLIRRFEDRRTFRLDVLPWGSPTPFADQPMSALREELERQHGAFARQSPQEAGVFRSCDELTRVYLVARAYDLYFYGQQVADATFPQPHLQGASATVAALARAIEEIVVEHSFRLTWQRRREIDRNMVPVHGAATLARVYRPPETLSARIPSAAERTALINACRAKLSGSTVLTVVHDVVRFCDLLARPENHVRVPSTQYVETQVNLYTTAEMVNQMEQELLNLRPPFAYVKSAWKGKIETLPFRPSAQEALVDMRKGARENAIKRGILKPRSGVEAEIRERQERWRRGGPGNLPPPTNTGGSGTPSLPAGGSGHDREPPPPTHIIPEKPQTPPGTKSLACPKPGLPAGESGLPVELVSLRFFESGSGMPPKGQRSYSTSFPKAAARYISVELMMENRLSTKPSKRLRVKTQYVKPDGNQLVTQEEDLVVHPDTKQPWYQWGIGAAQPGYWKTGVYRVVIFIDGVEFAEQSFTITADAGMDEHAAAPQQPPGIERNAPLQAHIVNFTSYRQNRRQAKNDVAQTSTDPLTPITESAIPASESLEALELETAPTASSVFCIVLYKSLEATLSNPHYERDLRLLDGVWDRLKVMSSQTIFIVTGTDFEAELLDRPVAERLRDAIDKRGDVSLGKRAIILGDTQWISDWTLHGQPVIAVGRPERNALTRRLIEHGGTWENSKGYQGSFIDWGLEGPPRQMSLWGDTAAHIRDNVEDWITHPNGLSDFLRLYWQ